MSYHPTDPGHLMILKLWGKETEKPSQELTNLAESSKEVYGRKRAVLPALLLRVMMKRVLIVAYQFTACLL
jgi:hypothetical protein